MCTTKTGEGNFLVHCTPAVHPREVARRVRPQHSLTTACARDDTEAKPVEKRAQGP